MEYVVKKERLKNYLYNLGFDYREVPDRTGRQKYVWLFENTEEFKEAITFYTMQHQKNIQKYVTNQ